MNDKTELIRLPICKNNIRKLNASLLGRLIHNIQHIYIIWLLQLMHFTKSSKASAINSYDYSRAEQQNVILFELFYILIS
jgi:hypothetical protein